MTTRYLNQLNRTYENQTKLMEQSDGAKLHRPSDDPIGYSKYLRYSISYGENNQYQANVKAAISWMKNSDSSLVDITNCFKTIVEKSNQAQGTNTDADMNAIAREMLVQAQQSVADANIQINGRYLFSGQRDLVQPYSISYEEKYDRGLTKTLDDKQADFFSDSSQSGDIKQMLVLEGDDGNKYFLNTKTGRVFAEDFVEEGYKTKIAEGQLTEKKPLDSVNAGNGVQGDKIGVTENTNYQHYNQRLIDANEPDLPSDWTAATGLDKTTMDVICDDKGNITHYGDPATGKVYAKSFVTGYTAGTPITSVGTYPSGEFEPSPRIAKLAMTPSSSGSTFASTGITVSKQFANALSASFGTTLTPGDVAKNLYLVTDTSNNVPCYYYNDGSSSVSPYNVYSIADITTFSGAGSLSPIGVYPSGNYNSATTLPVDPGFTTATGYSGAQLRIITDQSSGMPYYCDENGNLYDIEDTANSGGSWTPIGTFDPDKHGQVDNLTTSSGYYVLRGVDDKDYYADIITGAIINEETYTTKVSVPITPPIPSPLDFTAANSSIIVGDLYAQNQKYTYDSVVDLDATTVVTPPGVTQRDFFGADSFVKVTDAEGKFFYYNPTTHDVYTEDFYNNGWKASNTTNVKTIPYYEKGADAVDSMDAFYVAENFDSRGVIKNDAASKASGENWKTSYVINGRTISMTLATVNQYIATYQGDKKQFSMVKENGAVQPASDTVNASGIEIAGFSIFDNPESGNEYSGANAFNDMLTVVAMCERGEKEGSRWMSSDGKTLANNAYNTVLTAESRLAARQQVYSDCEDMLTTQNETILGDITDVHSTDVAKLAVEMMTAQTIYQLSLSVGSRILPPTLADYL